jgi:hypothetical protein
VSFTESKRRFFLSSPEGVEHQGRQHLLQLPTILRDIGKGAASSVRIAIVDFLKASTPLSIASRLTEASVKPENRLNLTSSSERVKTLARYLRASRLFDAERLTESLCFGGRFGGNQLGHRPIPCYSVEIVMNKMNGLEHSGRRRTPV